MVEILQRCVACDGPLRLFGPCLEFEYHRCLECQTIQLVPLPDPDELASAYASEYATACHYEADPESARRSAATYYRSILRVLRDHGVSGNIVDYGAGWGGLCEFLNDEGLPCRGMEMSKEMADYCQQKGLPVQHGDLSALVDDGEPAVALVLCTVFEHLVDYDRWLTHARLLLAEDGLLISLQPTARFAGLMANLVRFGNKSRPLPSIHGIFCPPWHTVLFSLSGMSSVAHRNGFEVIEIRKAPQGRGEGWQTGVQASLERMNRIGWALLRERWPAVVAHIFVLKKVTSARQRTRSSP